MEELLNKEHYCSKIPALLMNIYPYLPSIDNCLYELPHFYKKILSPTLLCFYLNPL